MHEYSIVMSLMEQCEALAQLHKATRIEVLSGVEPALLSKAFETFKLDSVCHEARLVINVQPLVLQCNHCEQQSQVDERTIVCPICQSNKTTVIDGEDMMLMQLVMDT